MSWHVRILAVVVLFGLLSPWVRGETAASNVAVVVQTGQDASWDAIFTETNQIPFYINLYFEKGLYYELMETSDAEGPLLTRMFSQQSRLTGTLGAKLQVDLAAFRQGGTLPEVDNGAEVRRFRVNSYGRSFFLTRLTYGVELGVTSGKFYFNDGYLWWHDIPFVGSFKFGLYKAPMSLEALESSSSTTMMETASPVSSFAPGYKFGMQLGNALFRKRSTLYGGWYADAEETDTGDASTSNTRLIGRATWLPMDNASSNATHFIHVGMSGSYIYASGGGFQYRSRPEAHLAPYLVDTGVIDGDRAVVMGAEAAWVKGPLSAQSELMVATGDDNTGDTFRFGGFYLYGSWILTGESRGYNRDVGVFKGVNPRRPISFKNRSWGAWEWAMRFSHVDLTDGTIQGGKMDIISTGLNCYLTKKNRLMFNLGYADVKDAPSEGDLLFLESRFQILF
jgi:phosphate-selective porin OprO/OprP